MASISQGIVGGEMAWPLVVAGIGMGIALILVRVKSPMLFSVGMYLPLETTFAIFVGGLRARVRRPPGREARHERRAEGARRERGCAHRLGPDRGRGAHGPRDRAASWPSRPTRPRATRASQIAFPQVEAFAEYAAVLAVPVMLFLLFYLVQRPLGAAGRADEPAPPTAVM